MKFASAFFRPRLPALLTIATLFLLATGCDNSPAPAPLLPAPTPSGNFETYQIIRTFPHDRDAFTQGLLYLNGVLYESTGLYGQSTLRKVDLQTGKVLQHIDIPPEYFAEGLAELNGKLYQLTWQHHLAFRYDLQTFALEMQYTYPGEGWGLTTDGRSLILSDGTPQIRFLEPLTFQATRTIQVTDAGRPVGNLNELEYIKGEIYANIWMTDYVVRIDPATGHVLGTIDFSGLLQPTDRDTNTDVLNGIAYDPATDRLFITGKKWPKLFEVKIKKN
jgi:glutamine cyclotransferase